MDSEYVEKKKTQITLTWIRECLVSELTGSPVRS